MRYLAALAAAALVALGLFWSMQAMISGDSAALADRERAPAVEFVRVQPAEQPTRERQRRPPERPPEAPPPPPPAPVEAAQSPAVVPKAPDVRPPDFNPQLDLGALPTLDAPAAPSDVGGTERFEGELIPLSQVPPQYPRRALNQGIEGWVRLEFTIAEDGSVSEIEILEAHPRAGLFDNAARRSLARWRFQPKLVDGRAVASRAEITLNFSLQDGY